MTLKLACLLLLLCLSTVLSAQTDSTLTLANETAEYSELVLRLNYANHALYAGRDLGVAQYVISGGASYYHKTGLFAEINGYWYSEIEPRYNLTTITAGYSATLTTQEIIGITLSYDRLFFNIGEPQTPRFPRLGYEPVNQATLENSLNLSLNFDFDFINFGSDYSFLFGNDQAHKLNFYISGYKAFKAVGFLDKITFSPTISALLANDNITSVRLVNTQYQRRRLAVNESNAFGLMMYDFSLPIGFHLQPLKFTFNYHYTIPQKVNTNDRESYNPVHYFTLGLSCTIR